MGRKSRSTDCTSLCETSVVIAAMALLSCPFRVMAFVYCSFETVSFIAQAKLELLILLPQSSKC